MCEKWVIDCNEILLCYHIFHLLRRKNTFDYRVWNVIIPLQLFNHTESKKLHREFNRISRNMPKPTQQLLDFVFIYFVKCNPRPMAASNSTFTSLCNCSRHLSLVTSAMSSAKSKSLSPRLKSLTRIRKSLVPRIGPWGNLIHNFYTARYTDYQASLRETSCLLFNSKPATIPRATPFTLYHFSFLRRIASLIFSHIKLYTKMVSFDFVYFFYILRNCCVLYYRFVSLLSFPPERIIFRYKRCFNHYLVCSLKITNQEYYTCSITWWAWRGGGDTPSMADSHIASTSWNGGGEWIIDPFIRCM